MHVNSQIIAKESRTVLRVHGVRFNYTDLRYPNKSVCLNSVLYIVSNVSLYGAVLPKEDQCAPICNILEH